MKMNTCPCDLKQQKPPPILGQGGTQHLRSMLAISMENWCTRCQCLDHTTSTTMVSYSAYDHQCPRFNLPANDITVLESADHSPLAILQISNEEGNTSPHTKGPASPWMTKNPNNKHGSRILLGSVPAPPSIRVPKVSYLHLQPRAMWEVTSLHLRITPTVLMELSRAQQVMLMFDNIIVWHSDDHNFSMQYKDSIWCSVDKIFEKKRGRPVKNFEVDKILERFRHKLKERQGQLGAEDDEEGIVLDNALSGLEPPKTSSRPTIFTDVKIYARHCPRAGQLFPCNERLSFL